MNIDSLIRNIDVHRCRPIKTGQSGAAVTEIDGRSILKRAERQLLQDDRLFESFRKEALFYQYCLESSDEVLRACIPEVFDLRIRDDSVALWMKKYGEPERGDLNDELLRQIAAVLARIHSRKIPDFLQAEPKSVSWEDEMIREARQGWLEVLDEHPGRFDAAPLDRIAAGIREIAAWHAGDVPVLSHGDFHWENLLTDGERIRVCDWQSVSGGSRADDLNFFISRLQSDGIHLEPEAFAALYREELFALTGESRKTEEIVGHMAAANVLTTFRFWHLFLHDSGYERVRDIYEAMTRDMARLSV